MYKETLILFCIAFTTVANAELEEIDLGEHKVSFDLGINKSEYEITTNQIDSENLRGEEIKKVEYKCRGNR